MKSALEALFDLWIPSPLQRTSIRKDHPGNYKIFAKRDDLIHYHISGNKYRKLKYNWQEYIAGDYEEIIAFGGAFSNLLYTLSFLKKASQYPMTFYIRGDGYDPNNPTLATIKRNGVKTIFVNRTDFRKKEESNFMEQLYQNHEKPYIIPEGGSNKLAIPGSREIYTEITTQLGEEPDYLLMDLGTAGTFCGVLAGLAGKTKLVGIPVLKGVDWINTIKKVNDNPEMDLSTKNFEIIDEYHFGGFAKYNQTLIDFVNDFHHNHGILIDPIYTGKLVYALYDLINKDYFKPDSTIVWVHAGGLQGIEGFNYLNGPLIND